MTSTEGLISLISLMTGLIFDSLRPARMIFAGLANARLIAVSAPRLLLLGPVMRTARYTSAVTRTIRRDLEKCVQVFPSASLANALATSLPVVLISNFAMLIGSMKALDVMIKLNVSTTSHKV